MASIPTLATLPDLPLAVWLVLAVLAYAVVTGVMHALANHVQHERERHDLVVAVRRRQLEYRRKGQRIGEAN